MAQIDVDTLSRIVDRYVAERSLRLSAGERLEIMRMAQGYACKESANLAGISYETIRARRKRVYRKLSVDGATEVTSSLLRFSLLLMAAGQRDARDLAPGAEATSNAP